MENKVSTDSQNIQQIEKNSINQGVSSQNIIQSYQEPPQIKPKVKQRWLLLILGILTIVITAGILGRILLPTLLKKGGEATNINTKSQKPKVENEPNPKVEILATLPAEDPHIRYNVLFDPYSHHAVYSIDKDKYTATSSSTVVIKGKVAKTYKAVDHLTISPDGKRLAYIAKQDDKEFVVVDEVEGGKYDYIKNLRISPDSQHIAYAAGENRVWKHGEFDAWEEVAKMFIVVDTTEGEKYDGTYVEGNVGQTYDPFFSKDGKKVTYTAIKNGKNILVVDDKEFSDYSNQQYPQFIGSSYDLIYLASENDKYFLVAADQKKTPHDYISDIKDLPYYIGKDAFQIAYEATDNRIRKIILNDLSYPVSSGVLQDLVFSFSGQHIAYYTGTWTNKDLYVDGKLYGNIQPKGALITSSPLFSPDEQILVYSQCNWNDENATIYILSVNSLKKIAEFPMLGFKVIGLMKFSDDGKYIYFKGWQDRKIVFVTLDIERLTGGLVK